MFVGMCFIMFNLLPFCYFENPSIRDHARYAPISIQTSVKYLDFLTKRVETHSGSALLEKFALVFDRWSPGDTHYLALFPTNNGDEISKYETALLYFTPFKEESNLGATSHYELLGYVLGLFSMSIHIIVADTGDNCSVNKCLARNLYSLFIGSWSHPLNLHVKDFMYNILSDVTHSIEKIQEMMRKLRTIKLAEKLRSHTSLKSKLRNATRWSLIPEIVCRYQNIRETIPSIQDEA